MLTEIKGIMYNDNGVLDLKITEEEKENGDGTIHRIWKTEHRELERRGINSSEVQYGGRTSGEDGRTDNTESKEPVAQTRKEDRGSTVIDVRNGEIELSTELRERGTLLHDTEHVHGGNSSTTRSGQTEPSTQVHKSDTTTNDGIVGDNGRIKKQGSDEMGWANEQPKKHTEQNGTGRDNIRELK